MNKLVRGGLAWAAISFTTAVALTYFVSPWIAVIVQTIITACILGIIVGAACSKPPGGAWSLLTEEGRHQIQMHRISQKAANDRYREASERLRNYDRRPDRDVEESNRLEQEKWEAIRHASWWLRWNQS